MGVVISARPGCPWCAAARNDLVARGVDYEEIDVVTKPGALEALADLTGGDLVVPVVVDDGDVRIGVGSGCSV